jgi:hypothetical protein
MGGENSITAGGDYWNATDIGGLSLMPVRASALLYTGLVAFTFAQALMGRPFLPGLGA